MEEREAMTLQQRMATALKDSDFEGPKIPVREWEKRMKKGDRTTKNARRKREKIGGREEG